MKSVFVTMILGSFLLFTSCAETNASTKTAVTPSKATKAVSQKSKKKSQACELLQTALVAEVFEVQQGDIENSKEQRRYCEKRWVSQIEIKDPNLALSSGKKTRSFRNRVALQVTNFHDEKAAEAGFKKVTINLDPQAPKDAEIYVKYSEYVDGVGQRAAWSKSISQLSVHDGLKLLHITVNVSGDETVRLAYAKKMAQRMIRP